MDLRVYCRHYAVREMIGMTMVDRPVRFEIDRPAEFRFTDSRGSAPQQGRTVNVSSSGVLLRTNQPVGLGRKMEVIVRMAKLLPDGPEVDLRLLGVSVRSGEGWVAVQVRKHQILRGSEAQQTAEPVTG
jgi:hypothetical protein